ncbi:homer [Anaeramoeba flamelloides]|uniref:Homer n=1 Tax=Anaeramoeba flamelloides TaxID=1746091 RepID=A0ABQ8YJ52_9EUKA|nr:homer [Anaeramoeba flamelloides]
MSSEQTDKDELLIKAKKLKDKLNGSKLKFTQLRKLYYLNRTTHKEQIKKLEEEVTNIKNDEAQFNNNFQKEKERRQQELKIMKESLFDKEEKTQYLNEELNTLKETSSIKQRQKNKQIQEITKIFEETQEKTKELEKENRNLSVKIEDAIFDFKMKVEEMKEKIDDVNEEIAKKKKKKKIDKFLEEQIELIAMKLNSDSQKSQLEQLNNDYDSLSRMLNGKVNEFKTLKKSLARLDENMKLHKNGIKKLKEKMKELKTKNSEMNNAIDRGIIGVGAKLFESRIASLKRQLLEKEQEANQLKNTIKELKNSVYNRFNSSQNNVDTITSTSASTSTPNNKNDENNELSNVEGRNARNLIEKLIESLSDSVINLKKLRNEKELDTFQALLPKDLKVTFKDIKQDQELIKKEIIRLDSSVL